MVVLGNVIDIAFFSIFAFGCRPDKLPSSAHLVVWVPRRTSSSRARCGKLSGRASEPIWDRPSSVAGLDSLHRRHTPRIYGRSDTLAGGFGLDRMMRFSLPAGGRPELGADKRAELGLFAHDRIPCEIQVPTECCQAHHDKVYLGIPGKKSNATLRQERITPQEE